MRKGIATKNVIGGKWVDDFYDKKTYVKVSNRKVRKEGKKVCRNYDID